MVGQQPFTAGEEERERERMQQAAFEAPLCNPNRQKSPSEDLAATDSRGDMISAENTALVCIPVSGGPPSQWPRDCFSTAWVSGGVGGGHHGGDLVE